MSIDRQGIRIAIHKDDGGFSENWIRYCVENGIEHILVDCRSGDIVRHLQGHVDGLLWHWHHKDHAAVHCSREIIFSLECAGIPVFPSFKTCFHFDNKIAQWYIFEALRIPTIPTHIFYDRDNAASWANTTSFPKVFKLKSGAGSENVQLVRTRSAALGLIRRMFSTGISAVPRLGPLRDRMATFRLRKTVQSFVGIFKGVYRAVVPHRANRGWRRHSGYAYFQDFIGGVDHDIRIVVIGERAFGIRRGVRCGDFRASGSGLLAYEKSAIPQECVTSAFVAARALGVQSVAFDFIWNGSSYVIIEISYAFSHDAYLLCCGYWTEEMEFINETVVPAFMIARDFLSKITSSKQYLQK